MRQSAVHNRKATFRMTTFTHGTQSLNLNIRKRCDDELLENKRLKQTLNQVTNSPSIY